MRIGILQTAYKKSSEYGAYYNVQELGLSRALAQCGHEVILYKGVDGEDKTTTECDGKLTVKLIGIKYLGINGLLDLSVLDKSLDVLMYLSDTQIMMKKVYKWCRDNNVKYLSYVGVLESHSENAIKRFIMKYYAKRNLAIYRRSKVLAKTPDVLQKLVDAGCTDASLFPVGLDESVMYHGDGLPRRQVNNQGNMYDRLLFVGRMEEEKHPLEMVEIYDEYLAINPNAKLTMIGDGYMYEAVDEALKVVINKHSLDDSRIQLLRKVPYSEMYNYYINSDVSINLNRVEILGMSILEALYYECPVIAIDAPGPRFILNGQDGEMFGKIVTNKEEILNALTDRISIDIIKRAKEHISNDFLWTALAKELLKDI